MLNWLKKLDLRILLLFAVFFVSRVWVLQHPPASYSDVSHDYERYANNWRYGLTPYRQILFEYPPGAIPLIALPLEIDQRGIGKYYLNYRVQIFVFDSILFSALVYTVFRLEKELRSKGEKVQEWRRWIPLLFYIFAGVWAKDYWYEGIDLIFMGTFTLGLMCLLAKQQTFMKRLAMWVLFWLSIAIKIMTAPMGLPLLLTRTLSWKKELFACALGALLVWGVPVALYRSSLSVILVFNGGRPMKYGAFGSFIVESMNDYTKSEHRVMLAPDFPMAGPISDRVTKVSTYGFPAAVLVLLAYAVLQAKKFAKQKNGSLARFSYMVRISLMYVFILFLTGKTFSSPFHIWYVPLLTFFPFASWIEQCVAYGVAAVLMGLDTTPFIQAPKDVIAFGSTPVTRLRDSLRFIPMFGFLAFFAKKGTHA